MAEISGGTGASGAFSTLNRISDRPRDTDGDRRQRTVQVMVRLTPAEAQDVRRLAAAHGLTLPALLRAGLHHFTALEG